MVLFYRGPYAEITERDFRVWHPHYQEFRIEELGDVRIVRTGSDPSGVAVAGMGGAALVAGTGIWLFLGAPALWPAVTVAVLGSIAFGLYCWFSRHPAYQLWAWYHDHLVLLFTCDNAEMFGQVCRGLLRAREWHAKI